MALIRKQKRRQRDKLRRQRQPRAEYLAAHGINRGKPWVARGESRATYYRRIKQEQARETGMHHINLIKTERTLVSQEKTEANAGLCERQPTPTPAGQVQTCVEWESIWAEEAAWMADCPEPISHEAAA